MPNIIWSPTMWFWAPCMIDADLVEQGFGFGEKTASGKFPLIPFPPNSCFVRLIPFFSAKIRVFPSKFQLKMPRPKTCSLIFLDSKVQTSGEFNPVEIGPVGDAKKNADRSKEMPTHWMFRVIPPRRKSGRRGQKNVSNESSRGVFLKDGIPGNHPPYWGCPLTTIHFGVPPFVETPTFSTVMALYSSPICGMITPFISIYKHL